MKHRMEAERLANLGFSSLPSNNRRDGSLTMPPPNTKEGAAHPPAQQRTPDANKSSRQGDAKDTSAEPPAEERLKHPRKFCGFHHAHEVLPTLGLSFSGLQESLAKSQGRPVLDLGSSISTVAIVTRAPGTGCWSARLRIVRVRLREALMTR